MKIKNLFTALLALPLFFVACQENTAVDELKEPTVKVTAMSTTETSVQFIITSTDATQVAYLVVEGSDVPNAAEILTNGKAADANVNIVIKEEGLKESTEYVVAVAAQNNKATVKDFITMTTKAVLNPDGPGDEPEQPGDEPEQPEQPGDDTDKVEFAATNITTDYEADSGLHYYYFELGDNTWGSNGWGVNGGTYYSFAIVSATKGNGVLPNGTYTLASSYSANTIIDDYSYRYQMANGDLVNGMEMFKDANIVITNNKIEANIEMANGEIHHVVYEGALTVGDGGTQVPVEFKATHTADKWYWGGSSSYGNKYAVSGEGFSVDVHFPAQYATETTLTAQLYTWTNTSWWGYNDFVDFTTRSFTVNGTSVAVDAGTAVVEAEGDVYHIEMTLQGRDGFTYMIEYNGKLNDKGEVGGGEASAVVFTNWEYVTYNSAYFYFEYKLTNEAGDKLSLCVNDYQANESGVTPGTYNWITRSYSGNKNLFSTNNIVVGGVTYTPSAGTLVVAEKATADYTITLTMTDGSEMTFTYVEAEGNEGGSTEPAEPVKLATPSVFGNVEGNTAVVSWQKIEGAKDYTVTLNGDDVRTVTTSYVMYTNLEYETTYTVTVVANSSDEALYITSDAGTATFTTEAKSEEGGEEGGNTGDSGAPEGYITLDSCSYVGDLMGAGLADEFVLRSNDGNNVLYFNCNNTQTDPNNIPAGEYTIANVGEPGFNFNMSYLSGVTIINGESYANGVGNNSGSTMVVASESWGGVHEIKMIINNNQGTTKYYYKGTIN